MTVSRLKSLLEGTAKQWYIGVRQGNEKKSWAWWKNTIRTIFGTANWQWKMRMEFEQDYFSYDNNNIHQWFGKQRKRLRAFHPDLPIYVVCEKILKQCT